MRSLVLTRTTLVWCLLVAATCVSWVMGHGVGQLSRRGDGIAILIIAFVKVRLVLLDFMELRTAPVIMRGLAEAWIVVIASVLIVLFLQV